MKIGGNQKRGGYKTIPKKGKETNNDDTDDALTVEEDKDWQKIVIDPKKYFYFQS